ncbi:UDP-glucose 4-epimerase GalE [Alkalicoccus daliensis]|uniref:UDP-glucose 4-epimerase n=1 Tax=Alkalicoccus daliensis TaxID=745820 RepID=A0A1G9ZLX9_9BACI|nr:UDP-glucose 4-epimerase GalE [Alkalicoccus daliensis]SDN22328.1 UDP-galactose 4-epimerase [Alkalicoccus daliensis]
MKILVTGGAGFIGSHTVVELIQSGHEITIADNFSNSNKEVLSRIKLITGQETSCYCADLRKEEVVNRIFRIERPEAVIHFAGLKAVGESVADPLSYYDHNIGSTINLLKSMRIYDTRIMVFSSSATVYGDQQHMPVTENASLSVTNPYGRTKLILEKMLEDAGKAYPEMSISILRYFNPIGAHHSGLIGEEPQGTPNNLAPFLMQAAAGVKKELKVFGSDYDTPDGTGIRDYIHVTDLALGHIAALNKGMDHTGVGTYNLGTGEGTSVLQLITAFEEVTGKHVPFVVTDRREGDVAVSYADTNKARKELGWRAKRNIKTMCEDMWRWQLQFPKGYKNIKTLEAEKR